MAPDHKLVQLGDGLTEIGWRLAALCHSRSDSSIASSRDALAHSGGARLSDTYSFPDSDSTPGSPATSNKNSDRRSQALPLRGLNLQSKPFNKRAVAWSCDAELAVAADDSVHIFLPEFPELEGDEPIKAELDQNVSKLLQEYYDNDEEMKDTDDDDADFQVIGAHALMTGGRRQFFEGTRQFPVTYPPLNTEINRHIWESEGLEFPVLDNGPPTTQVDDATDLRYNPDPYLRTGAGAGLIASVGSTLNHVIAIDWSPSGVGRNNRPVLGVLTASGVLAIYGEGSPNISSGAKGLRSTVRDLGRWVVLWAVGENFVVPGQNNYGERITSFSWASGISSGQAVLAYRNDEDETVFVGIGTEYKVGDGDAESKEEKAVWHVRELARLKLQGPHEKTDQWDPDYVPHGSAFALRWSDWVNTGGDCSTALLSYVDHNYVGFRKVVLRHNSTGQGIPEIEVAQEDWAGICIHLSPDAFVEMEPPFLQNEQATADPEAICRGVIATPFIVHPFQINMVRQADMRLIPLRSHSTTVCKTVYRHSDDKSTNPIQALILHPQSPAEMTDDPIYTLIRHSATATNHDWYETNAPGSGSGPQWAVEIAQKISVATPAGLNADADDSDVDADADADDGGGGGRGGGAPLTDPDDAVMDEEEGDFALVPEGPDVHPTRMRLWGLAQSPGGGSTVVLATTQMTQFPERGGWHSSRSRVLFGWVPREEQHADNENVQPPRDEHFTGSSGLTTEGKVWEWMYGKGAGVPGITYVSDAPQGDNTVLEAREKVKEAFSTMVHNQKCAVCKGESSIRSGAVESICEKGHVFATCGASGLAIQQPGISRVCGVCRCRCLKIEELVKIMLDKAEFIRAEVRGDVCMKCGGKFID